MSEAVLEEGASDELAAEVEAFNKEQVPESVEDTKVDDPAVEEKPAEVTVEADATDENTQDEASAESPFTFKVKGEEKEFSRKQIDSLLNREETFQQKNNVLRNSDEFKMGSLLVAAKGGDPTAQKKVKELLSEMTDLDGLDSVEGSYDVEEKHKESLAKEEADAPFEDIKDDVDYQQTLDRMQENFRDRMPSNIFNAYLDDPTSRRVMYDLEKSGRATELFDAFEEEISELSSLDRAKINSDSTLYGNLFVEVLKSQNAKQVTEQPKVKEKSDLSTVSSGNSSHSEYQDNSAPDWDNMSAADFAKAEKKAFKRSGF